MLNQIIMSKEIGDSQNQEVFASTVSNVSLDTLMSTRNLLNISSPRNIWNVMTTAHNVSTRMYEGLSQLNWDVFMPAKDEEELESIAEDYQQRSNLGITYLVAGIVFDSLDLNSSSTIKTGKIRIRMNLTSVMPPADYKSL